MIGSFLQKRRAKIVRQQLEDEVLSLRRRISVLTLKIEEHRRELRAYETVRTAANDLLIDAMAVVSDVVAFNDRPRQLVELVALTERWKAILDGSIVEK